MLADRSCVVEHAALTVAADDATAFEEALQRGFEVLARADGFCWAQALHQVEDPTTYVLLIGWDSVEAHTEGFVRSDLFGLWRAEIGPYLTARAIVTHHVLGPTVGGAR
ncbi:antibiotic biosynthesis monooxygenase family protein [Nocardioides sp. SR21]|uniref:antibiotic biosynthesis monooxygenase family protein n=1 Tax=Nocardioides sp. SR21 TaxID=2919501 RepID=UPI001FAA7842|nr:antibiotic biosynthesis monooxygenase family protein [Nocardioides sp. SR21]